MQIQTKPKLRFSKHIYLGVLWLGGVEVSTDPDIPSELDAGHEVTHKDVLLLHKVHVEEMRKRLAVKNCHDVWIDVEKERKRRRDVCTEYRALVPVNPFLEERFGALEPEVVESVRNGPDQWPTVASGNCTERQ